MLPAPSKSTRRQVQFSRRHSVVLRLNDERVLAAGGKFNSVAMVDISILETRWELSGDEYSEGPGEYSRRPHEATRGLKEATTRPQKVPASTQKATARTQKAPAVLTRQRKKRLLRTYVRTYVITLASCSSTAAFDRSNRVRPGSTAFDRSNRVRPRSKSDDIIPRQFINRALEMVKTSHR